MKNISILSTKKLKSNQKELLLNADFSVDEADFIKIKSIPFQIKNKPDLLLFTSQNGIKSVLENGKINEYQAMIKKAIIENMKREQKDSINYYMNLYSNIIFTTIIENKIAIITLIEIILVIAYIF